MGTLYGPFKASLFVKLRPSDCISSLDYLRIYMKTWLDSAVCAYIYSNVLYPRGLRHFMYMYDKLDFIEGKLPSFAELATRGCVLCPK